ncbi:tetratricopeptide repeat protein [Fulvivirga sp. RKSG066]|nr:tetratricopeptide repeat protein [Fulvivirga aurantia]
MKTLFLLPLLLSLAISAKSQPNCNAFLYMGDTVKFDACEKAMEISGHHQFSREFQTILDESIAIDPTFDYAFVEKSVAYLKSGDFVTWKALMDKAVSLDAASNLGYRGWCRYQFFRDYQGAIEDLERLKNLLKYDIGNSQNGDYHLQIVRGICYSALGNHQKAIAIIEEQLAKEDHYIGKFDYLHLGVIYLNMGEFEKALKAFENQSNVNDLAENHYYMALAYQSLKNHAQYVSALEKSVNMYKQGLIMRDPYTHPHHKVYLSEIEKELLQARG